MSFQDAQRATFRHPSGSFIRSAIISISGAGGMTHGHAAEVVVGWNGVFLRRRSRCPLESEVFQSQNSMLGRAEFPVFALEFPTMVGSGLRSWGL